MNPDDHELCFGCTTTGLVIAQIIAGNNSVCLKLDIKDARKALEVLQDTINQAERIAKP
jgi:hypothetical protein